MTCPATDANCAASQAGTATGAALSNNGFAMVPVDTDADPATFNSSSSTFTPAGRQPGAVRRPVLGRAHQPPAAGGRSGAERRRPRHGSAAHAGERRLRPGHRDGCRQHARIARRLRRVGRRDRARPRGRLRALPRSRTSRAGPATTATPAGRWSSSTATRRCRCATSPCSTGSATIEQNEPPLTIGVSGFRTPISGPVRTSVGLVAYEGDRGSAGRPPRRSTAAT